MNMLSNSVIQKTGVRQKVWNEIRKTKVVSVRYLIVKIKPEPNAPGNIGIGKYLHKLYLAGLLDRYKNGNNVWQYRLAQDLGAVAPVTRREYVWDGNSKQTLRYKEDRITQQQERASH